jgi:aryl-alcohol dehydrogenase-like predicted oxidoreductase
MKRILGNSGLEVAPIGLGGMPLSIQGRPDERTALAVIEAFIAGGGNHIDTAISYCLDEHDFGHNERLIAKALRKLGRTDVVVATKGGLTRPEGRWEVDCSPQWLRRCC